MTIQQTRLRCAHDEVTAHANARLAAIVPTLLDGTIEWGTSHPTRTHHTRDAVLHRPGQDPRSVTASLAYGAPLPELVHEQGSTVTARLAAAGRIRVRVGAGVEVRL
jgi:hypothetical protein